MHHLVRPEKGMAVMWHNGQQFLSGHIKSWKEDRFLLQLTDGTAILPESCLTDLDGNRLCLDLIPKERTPA